MAEAVEQWRALAADHSKRRSAIIRALVALALWSGLAALAVRLSHMPPLLLVGCALIIGSTVGAPSLRLRGIRPVNWLLGIYGLFAYHFCLFMALRLAPALQANLLNYLWPLLIVILSPVLVKGSRLTVRHVLGAILGFLGATLIVTGGSLALSSNHLLGYLLAFSAALIWSSYSLLTKRMAALPSSTISAFCLASGALSLLCHWWLEPRYLPSFGDLPYLLAIGLGPMGASFYLWDRALKDGDPRTIGTLAYLTPLLSTVLLAVVGNGSLSTTTILAGLLIVSGALVGTFQWNRRPAAIDRSR